MNVLSLFDGISCGQVALERAGIKVDKYFASEIDKYAIQVTQKNFPNTIQLGDITQLKGSTLPKIDLLIGGSPCQGFSFAGKQLNFIDPRSRLFFEYVRLLDEVKPRYFLLENVKMKKEYQDIISKYIGVEPIEINSALVSAQNRKRLYWTNIPGITQPEDKGIYLKDILESGLVDQSKAYCLDASYYKGGNLKSYFEKHRRQIVFNPSTINGEIINKATILGRRLNEKGHREDYNKSIPVTQCLEVRETNVNKSNCLTTVEKDNVITFLPPGRYPDAFKMLEKGVHYRNLTPIECERLQTLPDNYTEGISNTQRYKTLGNGWTVDVITHIFKGIKEVTLDIAKEA